MAAYDNPPTPDEYPCQVCGKFAHECICEACQACGDHGNPRCYTDHGMVMTDEQIAGRDAAEDVFDPEEWY